MINVHGIRRNMKNVVRNYTDAQIKVREATSNDPWGPSSTLMSEIADLTYNVVAFSEIMQMIWKRLNDHGRNWRHVYKALVLLEYLIKTGSEKVAQQCKENIFAIQTLKDFRYEEDNKDQGMNVREKSKQLVSLLKDDERLKSERTRALKAKERFAQATAHVGSETFEKKHSIPSVTETYASPNGATSPRTELECARPQTVGEEELQLQLALAMSKEEAEQEERMRRSDDLRLQIALTESKEDFRRTLERVNSQDTGDSDTTPQKSALDDLLGINMPGRQNGAVSAHQQPMTDPWGVPINEQQPQVTDPWGSPLTEQPPQNDAWGPASSVTSPAVETPSVNMPPSALGANANRPGWQENSPVDTDPWSPKPAKSQSSNLDAFGVPKSLSATNGEFEDFDALSRRSNVTTPDSIGARGASPNPFDMDSVKESLQDQPKTRARKTPESFLGPNSNLVNLEALVSTKASPPGEGVSVSMSSVPPVGRSNISGTSAAPAAAVGATNPFAAPSPLSNPFQAAKPPPPTINQLRAQNQFSAFSPQQTSGAPAVANVAVVPPTVSVVGGLDHQAFPTPVIAAAPAAAYPAAAAVAPSTQVHNPFL